MPPRHGPSTGAPVPPLDFHGAVPRASPMHQAPSNQSYSTYSNESGIPSTPQNMFSESTRELESELSSTLPSSTEEDEERDVLLLHTFRRCCRRHRVNRMNPQILHCFTVGADYGTAVRAIAPKEEEAPLKEERSSVILEEADRTLKPRCTTAGPSGRNGSIKMGVNVSQLPQPTASSDVKADDGSTQVDQLVITDDSDVACDDTDAVIQANPTLPPVLNVTMAERLQQLDVYPDVRSLDLQSVYLGARQLMALADLLRVELCLPKSGPANSIASAAKHQISLQWYRYSLLPELSTLVLRDMRLDFTIDESTKYSMELLSPAAAETEGRFKPPSLRIGGNEAVRYFLEALEAHPTLHTLDLSDNPIGPLLLPAISRLLRTTPTLMQVDVSGTLLSSSEQQMVAAQCLLNRLRWKSKDPEELERLRIEWRERQKEWLDDKQQQREAEQQEAEAVAGLTEVQRQLCQLDVDRPSSNGEEYRPSSKPTPYIKMESAPDVARCGGGGGSLPSSPMRGANLSGSPSTRTRSNGPLGGYSAAVGEVGTIESSTFAMTTSFMMSDGVTAAFGQVDFESPMRQHLYTTPYLHYYGPRDVRGVLTLPCVEVLRSAFMDPLAAQLTVLGGKIVPPGVPGPFLAPKPNRRATAHPPKPTELLREHVRQSFLMQSLRQVILPEPERPQSLFGDRGLDDPHFRTVAEENYLVTIEAQERQWAYIIDKLVQFMYPSYYEDGAVVYPAGQDPYWLGFVPPPSIVAAMEDEVVRSQDASHHGSEGLPAPPQQHRYYTDVEVHLQFDMSTDFTAELVPVRDSPKDFASLGEDDEGEALPPRELVDVIVPAGQFFGEMELLGGTAVMLSQHGVVERKGVDPTGEHNMAWIRETYRQRQGSASVHRVAEKKKEGALDKHRHHRPHSGSPRERPRNAVLWHIPLQVVFLYLYDPYQTFLKRSALALRRYVPTRTVHPFISALLAFLLRPTLVSSSTFNRKRRTAAAGDDGQPRPASAQEAVLSKDLLEDFQGLQHSVVFLEEGDFLLNTYASASGKWSERPLPPGTVLMSTPLSRLVEAARCRRLAEGTYFSTEAGDLSAFPNQLMGKAAALRQYREVKKRTNARGKTSQPMADAAQVATEADAAPTTPRDVAEQFLCHGQASAQWRYYKITNEDFLRLPEEVQLRLTHLHIAVEQPKQAVSPR